MTQLALPEYAARCLKALELAGYSAYAVGGCVRDMILGLIPQDYDLCTNATPDQIKTVFAGQPMVLAGEKHGTVGIITDQGVVEITTYRTEGGYQDNRHPDWVAFVDRIEEDLARRDFTVNAIAWSPSRGFADPFGGRDDLKSRTLRAVGDPQTRFREDSLRILRGVRFGVRYGLTPEPATESAMNQLAPLMENLARERVFEELCKLLILITPEELLQYSGILSQVIPELAPMVGFDQRSPHHAYDIYTHTAYVTGAVPKDLTLRWAALLHDTGKVPTFQPDETGRGHFKGHAQESARMADEILRRLKAPTALRERVVFLIDKHMVLLTPERKTLRRQLSRWGAEALQQLITLQQADFCSKGVMGDTPVFDAVKELLAQLLEENACLTLKDLAVNGHDLMTLGIQGKQIGQTLNTLLAQVLDEVIPNQRDALLKAAAERPPIVEFSQEV